MVLRQIVCSPAQVGTSFLSWAFPHLGQPKPPCGPGIKSETASEDESLMGNKKKKIKEKEKWKSLSCLSVGMNGHGEIRAVPKLARETAQVSQTLGKGELNCACSSLLSL